MPAASKWPLIQRARPPFFVPPRCPARGPWQLLCVQRLYRASSAGEPPGQRRFQASPGSGLRACRCSQGRHNDRATQQPPPPPPARASAEAASRCSPTAGPASPLLGALPLLSPPFPPFSAPPRPPFCGPPSASLVRPKPSPSLPARVPAAVLVLIAPLRRALRALPCSGLSSCHWFQLFILSLSL